MADDFVGTASELGLDAGLTRKSVALPDAAFKSERAMSGAVAFTPEEQADSVRQEKVMNDAPGARQDLLREIQRAPNAAAKQTLEAEYQTIYGDPGGSGGAGGTGSLPPTSAGLTRKAARVKEPDAVGYPTGMTLSEIEGTAPPKEEKPKAVDSPSTDGEFSKGFMSSTVGGNPKMLGRSMEVFGILTDSPGVEEKGTSLVAKADEWGAKYKGRVTSVANVGDKADGISGVANDAWDYLKFQAGNALGSMVPGLVAGTVGGVAGAAVRSPKLGFVMGSMVPSYVQNLGDVYEGIVTDKDIQIRVTAGEMTKKDLAAISAAVAVPVAALDTWALEQNVGAFFKEAKGNLIKRIAKGVATGAITEGATEGMQEVISQWAQQALGSQKGLKERAIAVLDNIIGGMAGGGLVRGTTTAAAGVYKGGQPGPGGEPKSSAPVAASDVLGTVDNPAPLAAAAPQKREIDTAGLDTQAQDALAASDKGTTPLERMDALNREIAADPANAAELTAERDQIAETMPTLVPGKATSFSTETGAKLEGQFALAELDDLTASHDTNMRENSDFPQQLQPRDRTAAAYEVQVAKISNQLNPERLGESPTVAEGAPITGADGVVESGNGRVIALARAYNNDTERAHDYKQWLAQNADKFGLNPQQVTAMKHPVLVRVRTTPVDRAEFARQANAPTTAQMSPLDLARSDAARMGAIDGLAIGEDGNFMVPANDGIIKGFFRGLPLNEQVGLVDRDGRISQAGYRRFLNSLLVKAYGAESPAVMRIVESLNQDMRGVTNALVKVAPRIAQAREGMKAGALAERDITDDLIRAIDELVRLRAEGGTVAELLAQSQMFPNMTTEALTLIQFIDANLRSPSKIAAFVEAYLGELEAFGSPNQNDMFGAVEAPGKGALIDKAIDTLGTAEEKTVPESDATLQEQQKALVEGRRPVQMFPTGTDEIELPEGMERLETPRGVFHYDPAQISPEKIQQASEAGRENEILGLGPLSKADVAASGEKPVAVVERTPDGTEVVAALTTPTAAKVAKAEMKLAAAQGNTVAVESPEKVINERKSNEGKPDAAIPDGKDEGGKPAGKSKGEDRAPRADAVSEPAQAGGKGEQQPGRAKPGKEGAGASERTAQLKAEAKKLKEKIAKPKAMDPGEAIVRELFADPTLEAGIDKVLTNPDVQADLKEMQDVDDAPAFARAYAAGWLAAERGMSSELYGKDAESAVPEKSRMGFSDGWTAFFALPKEKAAADAKKTDAPQPDMFAAPVDAAAHEAATSPHNDLAPPTLPQIKAGNYQKGHKWIGGLDISIENPEGSERKGVDAGGKPWAVTMKHHYGYIKGTIGRDKDHLDVFVKPGTPEDWRGDVFVVDQIKLGNGHFDEHKIMLGWDTLKAARSAYIENYDSKGAARIRDITAFTFDEFKQWIATGDTKEPAAKPATPAPPFTNAPSKEGAEAPAAAGIIEDFGDKITGARKDYAAAFNERMAEAVDVDIAVEPLSKSWPEPDYQKLLEAGANPWTVAFMHAARDEIPTKPTKSWRLSKWVEQVKLLREFSMGLTSGRMDADFVRGVLDQNAYLGDVRGRIELYEEVGHDKSLKGIRVTEGSYGVFDRVQYNPPKIVWTVEGKVKSTLMSRWPTVLASGDTKAEAIAAFKAKWSATTSEQTAKTVEFDVYSRTGVDGFFVGKKIGKKVVELKAGFATSKEARVWKQDNQAELVKMLERFKDVPAERRESNSPRVGEDHRNGANITPEQFKETFGFRGGQFGNTMPQGERQSNLNEAYDALMDLAGVIGIPPKALSLNGELGLAFGARGRGGKHAPAAHYEADTTGAVTDNRVVINLTRARGAGSIAHEWFHAVDNYFARMRGQKGSFLTETFHQRADGVRPEMVEAFRNIMAAIQKSEMPKRSEKLDETRTSPYWATRLELAARAFESYVIAKLQDQGASNDYLANIVSPEYWEAAASLGLEKEGTYPYVAAAEIPAIRAAFDEFFSTVQTRETERGVAVFSRPLDRITAQNGEPVFRNDEVAFGIPTRHRDTVEYLVFDAKLVREAQADKRRLTKRDALGQLRLTVDRDGDITGLNSITFPKTLRGQGWGEKVLRAILASIPDSRELYVQNVLPEAREFWDKMGVRYEPGRFHDDGYLTRGAYERARTSISDEEGTGGLVFSRREGRDKPDGSGNGRGLGRPDAGDGRLRREKPENAGVDNESAATEAPPSAGLSVSSIDLTDLKSVVDVVTRNWKNSPRITALQSPAHAPRDLWKQIRAARAEGIVQGAYHNGEIYLFANNISDPLEAERVLLHEATHHGLEGALGSELNAALMQVWRDNPKVQVQAAKLRAKYKDLTHAGATFEVLADMGAEASRMKGWQRIIAAVQKLLQSLGLTRLAAAFERAIDAKLGEQTTADALVLDLLEQARRFVEGKPASGAKLFTSTAFSAMARAAVTGTTAFKEWFGDSKVVDAEGRPLMVYHGTSAKKPIEMFDGLESVGWFSEEPELANKYAKRDGWRRSAVYPVYLSVKNPLELSFDMNDRAEAAHDIAGELGAKKSDFGGEFGADEIVNSAKFMELASKAGYDGVRVKEDGVWTWAPIDREQIKSAVGNRGTYERATSDIRLSRAGQRDERTPAQRANDILTEKRGTITPIDATLKAISNLTGVTRLTTKAYDLLMKLGGLLPAKVRAGLTSDYGIPEAVVDRRDAMFGAMRQKLRGGQHKIERLMGLTRAESRIAYEWMNGRNPGSLFEQLPRDSQLALSELRDWITQMGTEAVRLDQLSADAFERNKNAYLHRSYLKYEVDEGKQSKVSRERAIRVLGDQYKGRGLVDPVSMERIKNDVGTEFWQRMVKPGQADKGLKGERFIRLERRAASKQAISVLAGVEETREPRRLLEVAYWPEGMAVPRQFAAWDRDANIWTVSGTKGDQVMMWRDFTPAERQSMGEIDEVRYSVAKTLQLMIHDVEIGKYLEWLANTQAKPEPPRGATVLPASERMADTFQPDTWVEVPTSTIPGTNTQRYGKLAGLYLPGPVWNDVRQLVNSKYQPLGETYAAVLKAWKISKTALSPAVHMNNVMANVVMADWHDVTLPHILASMRVLMDSEDAANKLVREQFEDAGGAVGTFAMGELQREQLKPLLDALQAEVERPGMSGLINGAAIVEALMQGKLREAWAAASQSRSAAGVKAAAGAMIDAYQMEDVVFRLAAYIKAKGEGATDLEAGKVARKSFLDYNINAPWVQMMRQTAFPFISFTYRAVPMLLDTVGHKPWKLMKLALVMGVLNTLGYALSGGNEDKERRLLPEEKAGRVFGALTPKLIRMPWNDAHGSPVFLDIRRFIPVGDIFDLGQTHSAVPVLPAALPGGPLAVLAELMFNKSQFTGKEITKETDTALEKAGAVVNHIYKAMVPNLPFVPGTYSFKALADAGSGKTDTFGREQSVTQAALSSVGVKVASYPADQAMLNARIDFKQKMHEIDSNIAGLRREYARKGIDRDEFNSKIAQQVDKKLDLAKKIKEKVGSP